jgi:threonine dehydrogenase-like Zn-dependent dehydrogenase
MADYCLLPIRNLYAVPDVISDERAVFVEPLAAALEITEQLHIKPTDRVLVVGDGKLGLLVAQVLSLVGCDLGCIGHHQEKLEILAHRGIKICLAHEVEDERADVVVECTGHPDGLAFARSLLRPRGRLVLKSTYHGAVKVNMTDVVVDEIHLSGSRCGPFAPALRLLEQGLIDTAPLIDATYGLDQGLAAFKRARLPSALKVLVQME